MTAFVDASAIVSILAREPDGLDFADRIERLEGEIYISGLVLFEASIALARKQVRPGARPTAAMIARSRDAVAAFARAIRAQDVKITDEIAHGAIDAAMRFGKVIGHPANLNLGDCFAYACAAAADAAMLYKGDDFAETDIASA